MGNADASPDPPVVQDTPVIFDTTAHPAFDWSMPERYDASWAAYRFSTGTYLPEFVTPKTWSIRLDACDSKAVHAITGYNFTLSQVGTAWTRTFTSKTCSTRYSALPALGAYRVRLSLTTDWGPNVGVSEQVSNGATLKDYLVVSMGDSLASGEGNPDVRGDYDPVGSDDLAEWKDSRCHRSALSGPALAARAVEKADPHSSVTFVSVACSGAQIPDVSRRRYRGIVKQGDFTFPPQVEQVAKLVGPHALRGGRHISSLLLSAGVNDLYFSNVIRRCAKPWTGVECVRMADRRSNLAGLPASYHRLAGELAEQLPDTARVLVNNYPGARVQERRLRRAARHLASQGTGDRGRRHESSTEQSPPPSTATRRLPTAGRPSPTSTRRSRRTPTAGAARGSPDSSGRCGTRAT